MNIRNKAKLNCPPSLYVPPPPSTATLYPPQTPYAHQKFAVKRCVKGFKKHDAGRLHMPCGTGKTLVGMHLSSKLEARVILVVVPSISLLKQMLHDWQANCPFTFAHLAVCCDVKVDDDITAAELLPYTTVTLDSDRIAEFMCGEGQRVVFSTYASVDKCGYASNVTQGFDLVIADEAHHLGSARDDGHAAPFRLPNRLNAKKRIYMTATPYRLANFPDIFGPVFHQLTYPDATARGLLCATKTVVLAAYAPTAEEFIKQHPWIAHKWIGQMSADSLCSHALAALAVKHFGLTRVLSFHHLVASAKTFAIQHAGVEEALHAAHGGMSLRCEHIAGAMKIDLREAKLTRMRKVGGQARLLASAKCINEGCDIPGVDAVLFVDPKNSVEAIIQCAGRASRLHPGKKVGYILLPILVTDADLEAFALGDVPDVNRYAAIARVMQAMQELDPNLRVRMQAARVQALSWAGDVRVPPDVILHTVGGAPLPPNFLATLSTMILRSSAEVWEERAARMDAYVQKNGLAALATDASPEAVKLRSWMCAQRVMCEAEKGKGHAVTP